MIPRILSLMLFWLACVLAGGASAQPVVPPKQAPARPWYQQALVGLEVGPTGAQFGRSDPQDAAYCRNFNGRDIVQESVRAGAEYLVFWARDGDYAYYDSKILPKAPGLGDRDPLREALATASETGLPIIAYCVVQQAGHFLDAHPATELQVEGSVIRATIEDIHEVLVIRY